MSFCALTIGKQCLPPVSAGGSGKSEDLGLSPGGCELESIICINSLL